MTKPSFHLRPAVPSDVPSILSLIKALALYEKNPSAVQATEDLLLRNIFGLVKGEDGKERRLDVGEAGFDGPVARCALAVDGEESEGGEVMGMALYFFNFSTWTGRPGIYLEDLFVHEKFRGRGAGKAFFRYLAGVAKEKGCPRLDWVVIKWNAPSIAFYESLGAVAQNEWEGMRLEGEALEKLVSV